MDAGAAKKIAALCVERPGLRVCEVGAGTGALTVELLRAGARVTALEIDRDLVGILRGREDLDGVQILEADAVEFNFEAWAQGEPWVATGNLPYNVATALVVGWIALPTPPSRIVVMVQRDVAGRFAARPGSPAYGSLSVAVRFMYSVRRALVLGPRSFFPQPGVDSAVVVLERRAEPAVAVRDRARFGQVVRAAFAYRRKTLVNSLALALDVEPAAVQAVVQRLGLDPQIRGEQLDLDRLAALADALA